MLEALSGRRVVNAGSPGDTTADGLARIDTSLASVQPALVLLCLGINDLLRQVPVQAIERNLEQLAARVDAAGARLVVSDDEDGELRGCAREGAGSREI